METQKDPWGTEPMTERSIRKATAQKLLDISRLVVATVTDDGRKLIVRVIDTTDALPVLKGVDDTEEILLYVGPSEGPLPDTIKKAMDDAF